jgi:putative ABC transport system permease protein
MEVSRQRWMHCEQRRVNFIVLVLTSIRYRWERSATTALCVAAAFALFGVLQGVKDSFDAAVGDLSQSADRLLVTSRISRMDRLPIAHAATLRQIPGVKAVSFTEYLLAYQQDPSRWVGGYAVDIDRELSVFGFKVEPTAVDRMRTNRTSAIAGRELANRFRWKVGDRIPLTSTVWQNSRGGYDWTFELVGIYDATDPRDAEGLLINYAYFDEERVSGKGNVAGFWVRVDRVLETNRIAMRIDDAFMNSAGETLTQSGKELTFNRMRQLGNIDLIVRSIVGATLLLVFFVTGNTMRQSADERLAEFAVLRATGFSAGFISMLIIADAFLVIAAGAIAGLAIAAVLVGWVPREFGESVLGLSTIGSATIAALALALGSAALPAYRAVSMSIVAALRRMR